MTRSRPCAKYLTLAICAALFAQMYYFVYTNAIPLVKSDGWLYIQSLLVPWKNSDLTVAALWSHPHPQPLTATLFLLNARFFDLQMNYEALFAALFSLLLFGIAYRAIRSTLDETAPELEQNLLLIVVASVMFSLVSTAVLTWSLVTLFYVAISMSFLAVYFIDRQSIQASMWQLVFLTAGLCLLLITFSSVARIYLYSALIMVLLRSVIQRSACGLIVLVPLLVALVFKSLFLQWLGAGSSVSEAGILNRLWNNPHYFLLYIEYIGIGLLSPWLNIGVVMKNSGYGETFFINCGLVALLVYLATLCLYLFSGLARKTILPGVLILSVFLTALGGAIYRFPVNAASPMVADVPRYYLHYMAGVVGVAWVWWYFLAGIKKYRSGRAIIIVIFSAIVYSQYLSSAWAHAKAPQFRKKIAEYAEIMTENANGDLSRELPWYMVGGNYPEPYLSSLAFLKEHKLNLFRDSYSRGDATQ